MFKIKFEKSDAFAEVHQGPQEKIINCSNLDYVQLRYDELIVNDVSVASLNSYNIWVDNNNDFWSDIIIYE